MQFLLYGDLGGKRIYCSQQNAPFFVAFKVSEKFSSSRIPQWNMKHALHRWKQLIKLKLRTQYRESLNSFVIPFDFFRIIKFSSSVTIFTRSFLNPNLNKRFRWGDKKLLFSLPFCPWTKVAAHVSYICLCIRCILTFSPPYVHLLSNSNKRNAYKGCRANHDMQIKRDCRWREKIPSYRNISESLLMLHFHATTWV